MKPDTGATRPIHASHSIHSESNWMFLLKHIKTRNHLEQVLILHKKLRVNLPTLAVSSLILKIDLMARDPDILA